MRQYYKRRDFMYKILVIDDEPMIQKFLEGFLSREGYCVMVWTGEEIHKLVAEFEPDLVLLDILMPGKDGFEVCKEIRETNHMPIVFLSAKNDALDRILGLTLGADDFLAKPFDSAELLLRIRAILRRTDYSNLKENPREVIKAGNLMIDHRARTVKQNGILIELTSKEFDLFWLLASNPKQVFTRDQLIYQVWNKDYYQDPAIVTMMIMRLREKIEPDGGNPIYIKTVRGVGYKFGGYSSG